MIDFIFVVVFVEFFQFDVCVYVVNCIGFFELNWLKVLNVLLVGMIWLMQQVFDVWCDDFDVVVVVVYSLYLCVFCVGGDVCFFYDVWQCGDCDVVDMFFIEEYMLNYVIFMYLKLYIVLMYGVVMGGGMGILQVVWYIGGLCVVIDLMKMVMFEICIGLFLDVGMSWFFVCMFGVIGCYFVVIGVMFDVVGVLYV